jgi:hypothetical protein
MYTYKYTGIVAIRTALNTIPIEKRKDTLINPTSPKTALSPTSKSTLSPALSPSKTLVQPMNLSAESQLVAPAWMFDHTNEWKAGNIYIHMMYVNMFLYTCESIYAHVNKPIFLYYNIISRYSYILMFI